MGKASKWIRNLLMGKREDKCNKKTCLSSAPRDTHTQAVISPANANANTPKERRRWSFKRSTSTKPNAPTHKSSRSFDSIIASKQASFLEYQTHHGNYYAMSLLLHAHAAATKIQAVYRSYLAKRALRALKGLVKLQALARGHLVRKQMKTVLRSMHIVMAIQVKARIHRIQMAEEPPVFLGRRKSCKELSTSDKKITDEINDNTANANSYPRIGCLRSKSGRVHHKMYTSPSTLSFTDSSSTTHDGQLDEFSLKSERRNSMRYYSACQENKHLFVHPLSHNDSPDCIIPFDSHLKPNYMTNTKSSKAKARSHSEPRQRPKQNSGRLSSVDGKNDKESEYPNWLVKIYRSNKSTNSRDCNSKRRKSLIAVEPPLNLY
ncbi:hypothetical protein ACP275_02G105100 [Erythranthe tilingii]